MLCERTLSVTMKRTLRGGVLAGVIGATGSGERDPGCTRSTVSLCSQCARARWPIADR